jgi:choline monooxygenase
MAGVASLPVPDPALLPDLDPADLDSVPVERSETIPSAWYTDPRFHELDRQAVFGRTWQYVADLPRLSSPGDVVVTHVAGEPIIVVRDKAGTLHAFFNVCRHRGGPLALKDEQCDMLSCKYHGWTYRLDGMLRGVPHFNHVELFDKKDYGLTPVPFTLWEGLVFVHLGERPTPIEAAFTGIRERVAPTRLGALQFVRQVDYEVRCNWKVYVDNFLEGYHVPYVHPELCTLYDYQHYVTEVHDRYSVQVGPLTGERNVYTAGGGEALYYYVFPNLMLNVVPGRLQLNLVVPTAPDRCRVLFRYYYDAPDAPGAAARIEADVTFSDQVQQEDAEICERVQQGLGSRAYDRGRFSVRFEEGVYHFQQLLKQAYRERQAAP